MHLEIEGQLRTKPYDKIDNFNFPIVNIPFLCSNISSAQTSTSSSDIPVIEILVAECEGSG
jgi:hypothetical protein